MMQQVVLALLSTAARVVVVQQVWNASAAVARIREAAFVAGFVIRMVLVIVLMLAGAGLLSVLEANMLG